MTRIKLLDMTILIVLALSAIATSQAESFTSRITDITFPGTTWQTKAPAELGLNSANLDHFAQKIGGIGCIIRQGYMVKTWGDQTSKSF
jgi:hypothetical protein